MRPERDLAVAGLAREAMHSSTSRWPMPRPRALRIDDQQAQPRDLVGFLHQKDRADRLAVDLRDPAMLARRIEIFQECCDDLGGDRLDMAVSSHIPAP